MNSEDRQDERFDPDAVDEQIERLLQAGDRQHDAGAQITHDLVGLYQQDKASLEHIWRRLATPHALTDDRSQTRKEINATILQERDKRMDSNISMRPASARGRTFGRRIAMLASVACVVLVVGSLLLVLSMAAQKKHSTDGTTLGNGTKAPDVPGIYLTTTSGKPGDGSLATTIYRMDAQSHTLLWKRSVKGLSSSQDLVAVGSTIYGKAFDVSIDRSSVFAINSKDGSVHWDVSVGSPEFLTELAVANGTVYVMDWMGKIYSLNSENGKTNWICDTKLVPHMSGGLLSPGSVSVANGVVYNTVLNTLVAVDAIKGTVLWTKQVDRALLFGSPIAVGDTVYLTSHTENGFGEGPNQWGFAYAYDAKGVQKWAYRVKAMINDDPTLANGLVLFGAADHNIYALNAKSGKEIWHTPTQNPYGSLLAVVDGKVYYQDVENPSVVPPKSFLVVLDLATGKKLWSLHANVSVDARAVKDDVAYVGVAPHQVEELRTSDGKVLEHLDVGKFATDVPSVWLVS